MDLFTSIVAFTSGMLIGMIQVILGILVTLGFYWVVGFVVYMIWDIISPDSIQRFKWWANRKIKNIKNKQK